MARLLMILLTMLILVCVPVNAQSITGVLVGTIVDSSGGRVPGAKVKITNEATGIALMLTADEGGDYVVPNVTAGSYRITIEHPGFKITEVAGVRLMLNQTVRTDIRLDLGVMEQSVTVTAAPPVLQSDTSSISSTTLIRMR